VGELGMTLSQAITLTLDRAGLNSSTTAYKDQARRYLNIIAKRVAGRTKWWWLQKSTTFKTTFDMTVTGISGAFVPGEVIQGGGGSTGTGTLALSYDVTNTPLTLPYYFHTASTTAFSGTITGAGGGSATFASTTETRTYQLDSGVLTPHSFWDVTNDTPLTFRGWDMLDAFDPDRDETGDMSDITVEGLDDNTGKIVIRVHPGHSTTNETIRYRYIQYIPDWTSSNDSTELDRWIPEILQSCLVFGAAELYMQEKGDSDGAMENRQEYESMMDAGLETNLRIWGNRQWRRQGVAGDGDNVPFRHWVHEGSLG